MPDEKPSPVPTKYEVADLGNPGFVFIRLEDGRHQQVAVKDGVAVKRGDTVDINHGGLTDAKELRDPLVVKVV